MPIPDTAKEAIEALPLVFQPDKAKGMNATFQFELTGEGGGTWVAKKEIIAAQDWDTIQENCRQIRDIVARVRGRK